MVIRFYTNEDLAQDLYDILVQIDISYLSDIDKVAFCKAFDICDTITKLRF